MQVDKSEGQFYQASWRSAIKPLYPIQSYSVSGPWAKFHPDDFPLTHKVSSPVNICSVMILKLHFIVDEVYAYVTKIHPVCDRF